MEIITIGSATRDCIIPNLNSNLEENPKESLRFLLGEKIELEKMNFTTGGGATNSAYTFARQGFKTGCFAKTGKDVSGKEVLADLKKENIKTELIKHSDEPTAYSIVLLTSEGRTILVYRGAAANLKEEDFNPARMKSDWYYITSLGGKIKLLEKIIRLGGKRGVKIALNPGSKEIAQKKKLRKLLSRVEILLLNKEEALKLSGAGNLETAFEKLNDPTITVVTKGDGGSKVKTNTAQYEAEIFPEKEFKDRTGAGDAFGSGFVSGYIKNGANPDSQECIEEALRLGAANSTAIVEHLGAKAKILSTQDFKDPRWSQEKLSLEVNELD